MSTAAEIGQNLSLAAAQIRDRPATTPKSAFSRLGPNPDENCLVAAKVVIGVLRLVLHLPESGSLKAKRRVVSSLLRRVRNEFQVATAEVGEHDRWQLAELAICCVSQDSRHAGELLNRVLAYVEARAGDAVVAGVATEFQRV